MATLTYYLDGSQNGYGFFSSTNNQSDTVNLYLDGIPNYSTERGYSYYVFYSDDHASYSDTFYIHLPANVSIYSMTSFDYTHVTRYVLYLVDDSGAQVGTLSVVGDMVIVPFCFTAGSMVDTPSGQRRIETLSAGDMVLTRDNGPQPVRWLGRSKMTAETLRQHPHLRPIRIGAGTFGAHASLLVSPHHRMLVNDWRAETLFGEAEVLVAARELVNDSTVTVAHDIAEVDYIHLLFDRHELVRVNGAWSESFHPSGLANDEVQATRDEVLAIFPDIEQRADMPAARASLDAEAVRVLIG